MSSERKTSLVGRAGWALSTAALVALGALWHFDRTRAWESPRWDDPALVLLRGANPAGALPERGRGAAAASGAELQVQPAIAPKAVPAAGSSEPIETWAVAVNPLCPHCRASLARGLELRRVARAPVSLAVLVVDTKRRPSLAIIAALEGDELRWDTAGAWRHRWGHRVYGELLCFDRAGRCVRTLPPLADSLAVRRALRVAASLRTVGGS